MASTERAIVGGLLSGIGEGLVARGLAKKKEALRQAGYQHDVDMENLRSKNDMARQDKADERADARAAEDRAFRGTEAAKGRSFEAGQNTLNRNAQREEAEEGRKQQRGLLSNTREGIDAEGYVYDVGPDGQARYRTDGQGNRIRAPEKDWKGKSGMSVEDNRLLQRLEARFKDYDGTLNNDAMATELRRMGRDDLAGIYGGGATGQGSDSLMNRAREMALREAEGKAQYFATDATDFADDGGNREAFVNRRTQEIYRELKSGGDSRRAPLADPPGGTVLSQDGKPFATEKSAALAARQRPDLKGRELEPVPVEGGFGLREAAGSKAVVGGGDEQQVQGSGSSEDPYRPTTTEEFDALPNGAIFINPQDGRPYRKSS